MKNWYFFIQGAVLDFLRGRKDTVPKVIGEAIVKADISDNDALLIRQYVLTGNASAAASLKTIPGEKIRKFNTFLAGTKMFGPNVNEVLSRSSNLVTGRY